MFKILILAVILAGCDARPPTAAESLDREQAVQAERCKNGYSEGCDLEKAIAAIRRNSR